MMPKVFRTHWLRCSNCVFPGREHQDRSNQEADCAERRADDRNPTVDQFAGTAIAEAMNKIDPIMFSQAMRQGKERGWKLTKRPNARMAKTLATRNSVDP
jgi:hypothetical protein